MKIHPAADLLPPMTDGEFAELRADIQVNGQREPIVLWRKQLLDGRHRYRACKELGLKPKTRSYLGNDPYDLVLSLNLARRHLTIAQRATVAARLATMKPGRQTGKSAGLSQSDAAKRLAVSERAVRYAAQVIRDGDGKTIGAVERGEISLHQAQQLVQRAAKSIYSVKEMERHKERISQAKARAKPLGKLPKRYCVLMVDPPWQFDGTGGVAASNRRTENHYPTLTQGELLKLPVPKIAADDAVLMLWTTASHLERAMALVKAWDFQYISCAVWVKPSIGLGKYFRQRAEFLLLAVRGDIPAPTPSTRQDSVIEAPRGRHSANPIEAYERVEAMFKGLGPKLEMFARSKRPGWDSWGNEV